MRRFFSFAQAPALLQILATAFLLRAIRGYRPFPSVDDFAYVPLARAAAFPDLFPRDQMVQGFVLHAPVWTWAVRISERWLDLPALFWLLTMLLTVGTVAGAYQLLRAVGGGVVLLPLLAWIGFSGRVNGIMRGQYDGFVGDSFHVQWLALCLLLWAYAAFVERRAVRSGIFLGLAAISHPVVAAHGAFVILLAGLVCGWGGGIARAGLAALVVSAPLSIPLSLQLANTSAGSGVPASWLVEFGYLFRTPHEFSLEYTTPTELLFVGLLTAVGAAGAAVLLRSPHTDRVKVLAGMLLGHSLLLGAALLLHGPWAAFNDLGERSTLPFLLHLSRTSPMVIVIGATLALVAVEASRTRSALWWALALDVLILLLWPWWSAVLLLLLLWTLVVLHQHVRVSRPWAQLGMGILALGSLGWALARDQRQATLDPGARALYSWVRASTPKNAMFIVPPGFQEFRTYTDRGAYVDFKLFPASTPGLIPEWRRRLELISHPDSQTLGRRGWPGVPAWDSSYVEHNVPRRIAALLRDTKVDYFVLPRAAAWPEGSALAEHELTTAFAGSTHRVFTLKGK